MFAALVLEREPTHWADLPQNIQAWITTVGALAVLGLLIWGAIVFLLGNRFIKELSTRNTALLVILILSVLPIIFLVLFGLLGQLQLLFSKRHRSIRNLLTAILIAIAIPLYLIGFLLYLFEFFGPAYNLLLIGGASAVLAVSLPIIIDMFTRFSPRRIWAIALLSVKEAIRSRVIVIFSVMAIIFLFADYFVPFEPQHQVRNYVYVIYWSMTPLFLMTAGLLGAFNIPNDVRSQSIHTIVTKPVERFEIVLGRFLGYGIVLTVGLAALSLASLLYLVRGVHPDSRRESYTARVPIFCDDLTFWGTEDRSRGASVGRIWDYRSYIVGKQYAMWGFNALPDWLGSRSEPVPFEMTYDIFRLRKSDKDREGLYCTLSFVDGSLEVPRADVMLQKMREEERTRKEKVYEQAAVKRSKGEDAEEVEAWQTKALTDVDLALVETYKAYEVRGFKIVDYETQRLDVPANLFKVLNELPAPENGRRLNVMVSVETNPNEREAPGMLGVAKFDLYLLAAERPFWLNFLKGLMGMWCSIMLILGMAVACSTYLNGVISWMLATSIFLLGLFTDFMRQIASGATATGGPFESAFRLINRLPEAAPLEDSPAHTVLRGSDFIYRGALDLFLRVIPDINRYYLDNYVGNGFDISWTRVLFLDNFVYLVAYLVPWAILSYYLMGSREIANPS